MFITDCFNLQCRLSEWKMSPTPNNGVLTTAYLDSVYLDMKSGEVQMKPTLQVYAASINGDFEIVCSQLTVHRRTWITISPYIQAYIYIA